MSDQLEIMFAALQEQKRLIAGVEKTARAGQAVERAEIADSVPAYTLAAAPLAVDGGLGDGTSYVTLAWISNGRKSGEGAGLGTGVLAVYQASTDQWLRLTDYSVVVV